MNAREYYLTLQRTIHAAPHVISSDVHFEEIDVNECYVRGVLTLIGGAKLHIAEYIVTFPEFVRLKYRYHLQTSEGELICRWDNAPHHASVSTFPHHRHDRDGVYACPPMRLLDVLDACLQFI